MLGGSYQKHNWNGEVDLELGKRIMKRAVELCPSLTGGKGPEALSVIRHTVGLRPLREGGTRLEKEKVDGEVWVVHNYGHGGFGCTFPLSSFVFSKKKRKKNLFPLFLSRVHVCIYKCINVSRFLIDR